MQVFIISDEWYPVLTAETGEAGWGTAIEVDEATLARWRKVFSEFDEVQEELHRASTNRGEAVV